MRWVVFDGDVDALWVENMNSGTHADIITQTHTLSFFTSTCSFQLSSFILFLHLHFISLSPFFPPHLTLPLYSNLSFSPALPPPLTPLVMDDNRLLTLPNGERIRLQSHCALICETFDLQYASPATISRCGMVWVDPQVSMESRT